MLCATEKNVCDIQTKSVDKWIMEDLQLSFLMYANIALYMMLSNYDTYNK